MLRISFAALVVSLLVVSAWTSVAHAVPLTLDGSVAGPATCPGGTAVDTTCAVNGTVSLNRGCRYGGQHTFDSISLVNGAHVCVTPFNGVDKVNTGNLVLRSDTTIFVDATSRITSKGAGYQGVLCDDGPGPNGLAGGKGGCSVADSGGGGAHFGAGGRGTKDCFVFGSATQCEFPQEWEEDCGSRVGAACTAAPVGCYNNNALPTVAGQGYRHNIFESEFGAAGGDKGCRDGDGFGGTDRRAGHGGGRIVLFAANAAQTGLVTIHGRVTSDAFRGCSQGNDSAGGGGGGTILIVGDLVDIQGTARVSAHGGRGGDSQPKCNTCVVNADCQAGQTCTAGRCGPCNCSPCTTNAQCNALLGQTCKNLGGALGLVCADAANQCTPFDPADNENECRGTQNSGVCDDCGGGGGGGIVNVQSRVSSIDPLAIFDVRGASGGICPICAGEAGGGAGELQIDGGYTGEVCDGWDNDFNGQIDEGLGMITCPDNSMIPACTAGVPQLCTYDPATCAVTASDARPRFALIVDTSGSMLNDAAGEPTFGDGSLDFPGVDTASDADALAGNNSRLFVAKEALTQVLSAFPESDYALARYYQDVGPNRSCQTASNFECAASCCSYDDPSNNLMPAYPPTYPGNTCVLSQIYPAAGYPATPTFTGNMLVGWPPELAENPPTSDCINYAGSCGPPRRGAQFIVGFDRSINQYLSWLDGFEDADAVFDASTTEGNHCATGDCELRGTGPTPLGGALEATSDFLTPVVSCDTAKACRSYSTILLTDGAESCQGDPAGAAAAMFAGIAGKPVRTYVVGFSVLPSETAQLNGIAAAGGTGSAYFVTNKTDLANALAQIIGDNQKFELCNDLDDDCDTLIDEDFPEKGTPCTDGLLGVCQGFGTLMCKADGSGTECIINMLGQAPSMEICNQLDDDCDGIVDEDALGLPLPCSTCVPSLEVCDGVDNDCDLSIDEQADVAINQPAVFGIPCGVLTPPNDQLPCELGTVLCINAMPLCVGFKGPKPEICNDQDDDCDGIGDDLAACPGETQCVQGQCVLPCSGGEFSCPPGFECLSGFCFPLTCADVVCAPGETCQNGVCIGMGQGGGSSGDGGGQTVGQGGASGGQGGGAQTTGAGQGQGGEGGQGASAAFGLATGGGGCSASGTGRDRGAPAAWLLLTCLVIAAARRRGGSR